MKSFLMGLGIGVGLGVLFAPMSGEETRSRLSETASDLADSARDTVEQGRDRMQRGVSAIRSATDRMTGSSIGETRPTGTETSTL
ncbi:MAG TPA: YtxH domain-containing protein [Terriglobales bacterium]|nr:YtxH domain-containing protein [Terriglobales bacterium]